MPESLQNEKAIQLIYLSITSSIDGDVYVQALNNFEKLFGNDPSAQLALFDGYFVKGDYDKVLTVIDKIDTELQDPFLNYYRGLVYVQKKEDGKAIQYLEKLNTAMPNFEDGALELLANYLNSGQYKQADALITTYKHNTLFSQTRLNDIKELYPDNAKNVTW